MIVIKPYCKELEQIHIDFASKYWTKIRRKNPEYIYWKFRGVQNQILTSFILALENNKVIGQLGIIPVNINIEGEIHQSQWACDLMVDNDYRGRGVAKLLYDYAHLQKTITLGSDPSIAASKSMKKSGYQSINASYKFLFSLNLGNVLKLKNIDAKILNWIPNLFAYIYLLYGKFRNKKFKLIDNQEYVKLNYKNINYEFVSTIHDTDFLNWRYKSFKNYYKGIDTYSNKKNETFSGYFADSSYYFTDFNIKNWIGFFDIISQIINQYKSQGLKMIRFCSNDKKYFKTLWFLGFIKFRTRGEVIYYTDNSTLANKMVNKNFYYNYSDSDENI